MRCQALMEDKEASEYLMRGALGEKPCIKIADHNVSGDNADTYRRRSFHY